MLCRICERPWSADTCRIHDVLRPADLPDQEWIAVLDWCGDLFGDPLLARAAYLACRALANPHHLTAPAVLATILRERDAQVAGAGPSS